MSARKYVIRKKNPGWITKDRNLNTEESNAEKSERYSGEGNPFFGKKHDEATRRKMQRPKGVIHRGITPEEYAAKLAAGYRWCIGHETFLPEESFSKRGYRNGIHRAASRCKVCTRRAWLRKAYKVSPEWYDWKLQEQGGHCALCLMTEAEERRPLCVDHNHGNGATRGILCIRCNSHIERMELNGWHEKALAYLSRYASLIATESITPHS